MGGETAEDSASAPPAYTSAYDEALKEAQGALVRYEKAQAAGDNAAKASAAEEVPRAYRGAAEHAPDAQKADEHRRTADEWAGASDAKRGAMLHPLLKGVLVLLALPFAVAGGAVYGAGVLLMGIGDVLTGTSKGRAKAKEYIGSWF